MSLVLALLGSVVAYRFARGDEVHFLLREAQQVPTPGAWAYLSPVVDLNLDGFPDFVSGMHFYRGNGDGTFTAEAVSSQAMAVMAAGDVDGDQVQDLLALVPWHTEPIGGGADLNREFRVLRTQVEATGSVSLSSVYAVPARTRPFPHVDSMYVEPVTANWGDLNNDGQLDFVSSGESVTEIPRPGQPPDYLRERLFFVGAGDGTGSLGLLRTYPAAPHYSPMEISLVDLNADGFLDVVSPNARE